MINIWIVQVTAACHLNWNFEVANMCLSHTISNIIRRFANGKTLLAYHFKKFNSHMCRHNYISHKRFPIDKSIKLKWEWFFFFEKNKVENDLNNIHWQVFYQRPLCLITLFTSILTALFYLQSMETMTNNRTLVIIGTEVVAEDGVVLDVVVVVDGSSTNEYCKYTSGIFFVLNFNRIFEIYIKKICFSLYIVQTHYVWLSQFYWHFEILNRKKGY